MKFINFLKIALSIFVVITLLFYMSNSFLRWELNPLQWDMYSAERIAYKSIPNDNVNILIETNLNTWDQIVIVNKINYENIRLTIFIIFIISLVISGVLNFIEFTEVEPEEPEPTEK